MIEGHDYCIWRVSTRDNGYVSILNHLVDNSSKVVASIGKVDDSHLLLRSFNTYQCQSSSSVSVVVVGVSSSRQYQ